MLRANLTSLISASRRVAWSATRSLVPAAVLVAWGCGDSRSAPDPGAADGATDAMAATSVAPDGLEVGTRYRFARATPLVPDLDPGDPAMAMAEPVLLPDDTNAIVLDRVEAAGTVWYQVQSEEGTTGWVSVEALRGRDVFAVP